MGPHDQDRGHMGPHDQDRGHQAAQLQGGMHHAKAVVQQPVQQPGARTGLLGPRASSIGAVTTGPPQQSRRQWQPKPTARVGLSSSFCWKQLASRGRKACSPVPSCVGLLIAHRSCCKSVCTTAHCLHMLLACYCAVHALKAWQLCHIALGRHLCMNAALSGYA